MTPSHAASPARASLKRSTTGEAEMFPRRYDVDGYAFALDMLRVIA